MSETTPTTDSLAPSPLPGEDDSAPSSPDGIPDGESVPSGATGRQGSYPAVPDTVVDYPVIEEEEERGKGAEQERTNKGNKTRPADRR